MNELTWNDFYYSDEEKEKWQSVFDDPNLALSFKELVPGITPEEALKYHQNALTPHDVIEYAHNHINDGNEAIEWKKSEISPEMAGGYKAQGINFKTYDKYKQFGITDVENIVKYVDNNDLNIEDYKPLIDNGTIKIEDITTWLSSKIKPEEIKKWVDVGINDPDIIFQWKDCGMSLEMAIRWLKVVSTPQEAYEWIRSGWKNPSDVLHLKSKGLESPEDVDQSLDNLKVKF